MKMEVTYYYSDDCGVDLLLKKVRNPKKGIFTGYIWGCVDKKWNENWERASEYFYEAPSEVVDAKFAKEYMVRYGATAAEADAALKKDIGG